LQDATSNRMVPTPRLWGQCVGSAVQLPGNNRSRAIGICRTVGPVEAHLLTYAALCYAVPVCERVERGKDGSSGRSGQRSCCVPPGISDRGSLS
jgi:hypothetical protein